MACDGTCGCPECEAQQAGDDLEVGALEWGLLAARSRVGTSDFWASATTRATFADGVATLPQRGEIRASVDDHARSVAAFSSLADARYSLAAHEFAGVAGEPIGTWPPAPPPRPPPGHGWLTRGQWSYERFGLPGPGPTGLGILSAWPPPVPALGATHARWIANDAQAFQSLMTAYLATTWLGVVAPFLSAWNPPTPLVAFGDVPKHACCLTDVTVSAVFYPDAKRPAPMHPRKWQKSLPGPDGRSYLRTGYELNASFGHIKKAIPYDGGVLWCVCACCQYRQFVSVVLTNQGNNTRWELSDDLGPTYKRVDATGKGPLAGLMDLVMEWTPTVVRTDTDRGPRSFIEDIGIYEPHDPRADERGEVSVFEYFFVARKEPEQLLRTKVRAYGRPPYDDINVMTPCGVGAKKGGYWFRDSPRAGLFPRNVIDYDAMFVWVAFAMPGCGRAGTRFVTPGSRTVPTLVGMFWCRINVLLDHSGVSPVVRETRRPYYCGYRLRGSHFQLW